MSRILVVAPHPDDETLGVGGTLLKHRSQGDEIHWLIVTRMDSSLGFTPQRMESRQGEIKRVAEQYGFAKVHQLDFVTTQLDSLPMSSIVSEVNRVFHEIKPEVVYLPFRGDIHTDHRVTFDAVTSCTKWFRHPSIRRILAYETLSETDQGFSADARGFLPTCFVDVAAHLEKKIRILTFYEGEVGEFPFPRSEKALRGLAAFRGAQAGFHACEAFVLLRERIGDVAPSHQSP